MRGIGCLSMVVVPFFSYGVADFLVRGPGRAWPIPQEWLGNPQIPQFFYTSQYLRGVASFLAGQNNLIANLVFGFFVAIILFGLMSIIFGYAYSMMAPSTRGPFDVPAPRVKTKKYNR
jgi:hypothetical protein